MQTTTSRCCLVVTRDPWSFALVHEELFDNPFKTIILIAAMAERWKRPDIDQLVCVQSRSGALHRIDIDESTSSAYLHLFRSSTPLSKLKDAAFCGKLFDISTGDVCVPGRGMAWKVFLTITRAPRMH